MVRDVSGENGDGHIMRHIVIEMWRDYSCAEQIHMLVCAPAFGVPREPTPKLFNSPCVRIVLNDQESRVVVLQYGKPEPIEIIKQVVREVVDAC